MLSQRIQANLKPSPMFDFMSRAISNPYHPSANPNGIISLGIAENSLMAQSLATFLSQNLRIPPGLFSYGASCPGLASLYQGLCKLYNGETFDPAVEVENAHLYVTAGCTTLLDQIFWTLCDKGDGVLIGRPCYGGFVPDMSVRSGCVPILVSLKGIDPFSEDAVVRYEEDLLEAQKRGVKVRMLVLCTPHNPLGQYLTNGFRCANGRCYPRETMVEFMKLCQKYQIHLLSDEIYALTTFATRDIPNPTPFTSLLSIDKVGIIDPSLCHVIHGLSKVSPFPIHEIILGFLLQWHSSVHVDISSQSRLFKSYQHNSVYLYPTYLMSRMFSWPSSMAGLVLSTILNHPTYLTDFLKQNRKLLVDRYTLCTNILKAHSIAYMPSNAGFFLWADLSPSMAIYEGTPLEQERALNKRLFEGGVHLATSEAFQGEEYGWFRISFSVDENVLELGLKR